MGEQLELDLRLRSWGGARTGAGRPKAKKHLAMPHRTRGRLKRWEPVHVTLRVGADVPCLRNSEIADLIESCLYRQRKRRPRDFQVVHDSIQDDHIHLIAEALDAATLGRGVAALKILIAKSMNRVAERRGRVFTDRYHRQDLTTPTQVRNALSYVLMNLHKHSRVYSDTAFADPRSSAPHVRRFHGSSRDGRFLALASRHSAYVAARQGLAPPRPDPTVATESLAQYSSAGMPRRGVILNSGRSRGRRGKRLRERWTDLGERDTSEG